jgi:hypothetical protein
MSPTTQGGNISGSRVSSLIYAISLAFPSWGGLLAALYILVGCGVRTSAIRDFWRAL